MANKRQRRAFKHAQLELSLAVLPSRLPAPPEVTAKKLAARAQSAMLRRHPSTLTQQILDGECGRGERRDRLIYGLLAAAAAAAGCIVFDDHARGDALAELLLGHRSQIRNGE